MTSLGSRVLPGYAAREEVAASKGFTLEPVDKCLRLQRRQRAVVT